MLTLVHMRLAIMSQNNKDAPKDTQKGLSSTMYLNIGAHNGKKVQKKKALRSKLSVALRRMMFSMLCTAEIFLGHYTHERPIAISFLFYFS